MERRLQLLLDHARYERVSAAAELQGVSVSAAIRQAIDLAFPEATTTRAAAARSLLELSAHPGAEADAESTDPYGAEAETAEWSARVDVP